MLLRRRGERKMTSKKIIGEVMLKRILNGLERDVSVVSGVWKGKWLVIVS